MRELAGRLRALDPEASQTLKVITYFDRLVDGRVGAEGLLRGAAVLAGIPVGHAPAGAPRGRRFGPDVAALPEGSPEGWPHVALSEGAVVWLERGGPPHANDAMVLERLAISLSILSTRLDTEAPTRRAVETLVSADASDEEREGALQRLALPMHVPVRALAVPTGLAVAHAVPHAVVATRFGVVRAALTVGDAAAAAAQVGIGVVAARATEISGSWRSALIALRLTDAQRPVVRADELGSLLVLAQLEDTRSIPHPDVIAVGRALDEGWTEPLLRSLAAGTSRRALAAAADVHHSTMGARVGKLTTVLDFDPSTPFGRTRLDVALLLYRLASSRVDSER